MVSYGMANVPEQSPYCAMSLHEITREFSEAGLRERLSDEIGQTDWNSDVRHTLQLAEELAILAHSGVTRGDHPYSTHFLRVAVRIISSHHMAIQDPDLIVAALLHDTVEDAAEFYASVIPLPEEVSVQEHAFTVLTLLFNERVAGIIRAVTNPERPSNVSSIEEKHAFYQAHVRDVLTSEPEAGIIKLSDFIDNCLGLKYNEDPVRQQRLTTKYLPLINDFRRFIDRSTLIPEERKTYLQDQLNRAEDLCKEILER